MGQQPAAASLVAAARNGDQAAWNALVDEYLPLVHGVIGRFRLSQPDAADVNQTVWLRLVEHLHELREPQALPGWLATTARREALRVIRSAQHTTAVDPQSMTLDEGAAEQDVADELLREEGRRAVRAGLAELPAQRRRLLELVMGDPPVAYEEISRILNIPIGSIGPTRARALRQLRSTRAMLAYLGSTDSASAGGRG